MVHKVYIFICSSTSNIKKNVGINKKIKSKQSLWVQNTKEIKNKNKKTTKTKQKWLTLSTESCFKVCRLPFPQATGSSPGLASSIHLSNCLPSIGSRACFTAAVSRLWDLDWATFLLNVGRVFSDDRSTFVLRTPNESTAGISWSLEVVNTLSATHKLFHCDNYKILIVVFRAIKW